MIEFPGAVPFTALQIGMATDSLKGTGVTVVVFPAGARGAADVSGGAPATRETAALAPENLVSGPDAIVLCGGSAFGLQAADGAAQALRHARRGFAVGSVRVPVVAAAAIFDLDYRLPEPPTAEDGRSACQQALAGALPPPLNGSLGAGTGATVGKLLGSHFRMKSGQAAWSLVTADGLEITVLVVVNAAGSIKNASGTVIAGPQLDDGKIVDTTQWLTDHSPKLGPGTATTLGVVVTNGYLSKAELARVARMAHDGLARAIDPVHTPWDGDTIFAVSYGNHPADTGRTGALAAYAVSQAIRHTTDTALHGAP